MINNMIKYLPIPAIFITWAYIYFQGISTAINIWTVSEIFNHCYLVIPGALFLIYQKRAQLIQQKFIINYWLLIPLIGTLIVYTFGYVGDIRLFMHIATFVSLPLLIWLIIGNAAAKTIAFPLYFMVFAIPVGEQFIPFLQELTTNLSVPLLEMTGVPIYRNGLYLDIPEGRFLVAEACSGISFLVASFVFGNLYAHISFKTLPKQLTFVLISFVVPIIANALRVYGIVLTAHLTDMEYAAGADHLIYGGVFYAIILFLLIFIGERFRDKELSVMLSTKPINNDSERSSKHWLVFTVIISLFFLQSAWVNQIENNRLTVKLESIINVESLANNIQHKALIKWQPNFPLATEIKQGTLNNDDNLLIDFFIAGYVSGKGELISSLNRLYSADRWSLTGTKSFTLKGTSKEVLLTQLISPEGEKRTIIYWYQLSGETFISKIKMKINETFNLLIGKADNSALIAFSIQELDYTTQNESLLIKFIEDNQAVTDKILVSK